MHGLVRFAFAAAVVIAAVGGFMLLPGLGLVAAPNGSASPTPSGTACPWRNPFPEEAVDACRKFGGPLTDLPQKSGSVVVDGVPFSFKVRADGWEQFSSISLNKSVVRGQAAEALIYWTAFPSGAIAERCFPALWKRIGPSITDAADAVAAADGVVVVARSDVQVGGHPAKYVELSVRDERFGCDPGYFHLWAAPPWGALWLGPGEGATIRVWLVDVDGVRLFIAGETTAEVDPAFGQEIQYIIDSIRFE